MSSNQIQEILAKHKNILLLEFGVVNISIFGSYARNEENAESDIDLAVEIQKPNLFIISALKEYLQDILHKNVDIVRIRKNMNQLLRQRIKKDAIFIR